MKILSLFCGLVVTAFAATPNASSIVDPYLAAHEKRDVDALMALVEISSDTPASIIEQTKSWFRASFDLKVVDARVLPIDGEDEKNLSAMREAFDPTLEPVAKLVVTWDVAAQKGPAKTPSLTKFLGVKDGRYRFVTAKKKPNKAPDRTAPSVTPPAGQEAHH